MRITAYLGPFRSIAIGVSLACTGSGCAARPLTSSRTETPSLKSLLPSGPLIGAALANDVTDGKDPVSAGITERHMNSITPENLLKWQEVHPQPSNYRWGPADRYVAFGEKGSMFVVGHALVWHEQIPAWVFTKDDGTRVDRETLLGRMRDHIQTVVRRYRGRIHGWDVVNEAMLDDGSLRPTGWSEIVGPDFIAKAFEYAHAADPQAELYYNDYNLWEPGKRAAVLRLVADLRAKGLRIDGVGEQAHYSLDKPNLAEVESTITALAAVGVKVMLTEVDIDVLPRAPEMWGADLSNQSAIRATTNLYPEALPPEIQEALANRYIELFNMVLRHQKAIHRVTFWGVTDRTTWLNSFPIPGRVNHPLLWDRKGWEKPAFHAVVRTLTQGRGH